MKLTERGNDIAGLAVASHEGHSRNDQSHDNQETLTKLSMTEASQSATATLPLRVAEARVEDVGHAIARLAPLDLQRIGARTGDVFKITGATVGDGRAELSDYGHEGMVH